MHTLVPAPPRRRPINWYRVISWTFFLGIVAFSLYAAVDNWSYFVVNAAEGDGIQHLPGGFWPNTYALVGMFTIYLIIVIISGAAIVAFFWLLGRLGDFIDWWDNKIHETDQKNSKYSEYQD